MVWQACRQGKPTPCVCLSPSAMFALAAYVTRSLAVSVVPCGITVSYVADSHGSFFACDRQVDRRFHGNSFHLLTTEDTTVCVLPD